jgi:hypothetical protein
MASNSRWNWRRDSMSTAIPMNHNGREIVELRTLYQEETCGSNSRIPKPMFIATPRTAPSTSSASKSAFQVLIFEVRRRAIAVAGAIDACANIERIAQLKKSLEPVLA